MFWVIISMCSFVCSQAVSEDLTSLPNDHLIVKRQSWLATQRCEASETKTREGSNPCRGDLIFSEDFSNGLERKIWTVEQRYAGAPDYEFVMYMDRPETMLVDSGILKIKPVLTEEVFGNGFITSPEGFNFKEHCTGIPNTPACARKHDAGFILPPVVSSQISTRNRFSFKYGKIEIRAKLPRGDWIYPELILGFLDDNKQPDYESGQIRVAFVPGNSDSNNVLYGGVIVGASQAGRTYGMKSVLKTVEMQNGWSNNVPQFNPTQFQSALSNALNANSIPNRNIRSTIADKASNNGFGILIGAPPFDNNQSGGTKQTSTSTQSPPDSGFKGGILIGVNPFDKNNGLGQNNGFGQNNVFGQSQKKDSADWSDDFHRFAVIWEPENLTLSVDDKIYGTVYPPPDGFSSLSNVITNANKLRTRSKLAPFDREMYISIGVGVGGFNFEDSADSSKPWKNGERLMQKKFYNAREKWMHTWDAKSVLEVDHVKVWAL